MRGGDEKMFSKKSHTNTTTRAPVGLKNISTSHLSKIKHRVAGDRTSDQTRLYIYNKCSS